jgi:uncharacterized protein with von Willebrand factor type A (vWA) domain
MIGTIIAFIDELRTVGVPVSMVEAIDALAALEHVDLGDRTAFKHTLGATMVKNERHYEAFDAAFEAFFALHRDRPDRPGPDRHTPPDGRPTMPGGGYGGGDADLEELARAIVEALSAQDWAMLGAGAQEAVRRLAGIEPGRPVGGTYYLYRTMRRLDVDGMLERLLAEAQVGAITPLEERLLREEMERRIDRLRSELQAEIRRLLVADRGREAVARTLRAPLLEDIDLMHATRHDLARVEKAIRPLTRKLAARLAQKRKRRRAGRLDFRRTMRRALATGGVPFEPVFRSPNPHKPDIILLCDVSGSMATFARFTLQFTYAMSGQFSKVRSFAFIDGVDEVTGFFEAGADFAGSMERITTEADVVWLDGHSDYGNALERFRERFGEAVTPRSTVIITGDARSNYRNPRPEVLGALSQSARTLYWLNPEPRAYWDTGDSVMSAYAPFCDGVHEVRNLRQLEAFVEQVALPAPGRLRLAVG